jgi:hypothetical protein
MAYPDSTLGYAIVSSFQRQQFEEAIMAAADIVAILSIVVSGIISVVAIVSNILINRANILAKRNEMAFTEQLKVFFSIVEQVTDIEYQRNNLRDLYAEESVKPGGGHEQITRQIQEIHDKISKLLKIITNSSIFVPPHILKGVGEYIQTVSDALAPQIQLGERVEKIGLCKPNVSFIHDMRKFIGIKE